MRHKIKEEGISVALRDNESIDSLIRRFKKKFVKSGIMKEIRNKEFYLKPSMRKKLKRREAERTRRREEAKIAKKMFRSKRRRKDDNVRTSGGR